MKAIHSFLPSSSPLTLGSLPLADTFRQPVSFPQKSIEFALAPGDSVDFPVLIQNPRTTSSGSVTVSAATASGSGLSTFGWVGTSGSVTATTTLSLAGSELATRTFRVTVAAGAAEDSVTTLELTPSASGYSDPTIPLIIEVTVKTKPTSPPKTHPFLFIDTSDIADLKQKAADNDWAASYLASIQGWVCAVSSFEIAFSIPLSHLSHRESRSQRSIRPSQKRSRGGWGTMCAPMTAR